MPQENQVLRCYSCLTFQVHLVKKQKKWQCKICNSKQSVKQIYGKGSGKDCRLHVMKLNELQFSGHSSTSDCDINTNELKMQDCNPKTKTFTVNDIENESKWSHYMNKVDEISDEEEEEINIKIMDSECFNKKKRKSNCIYSSSEMSSELNEKSEYHINEGIETKEKKKHEDLKKCGETFYGDCIINNGSKWSAFTNKEQFLSNEKCESGTETTFMSEAELGHAKSKPFLGQESLKTEKLQIKRDRETCPTYRKYLVNTHFDENSILTDNEKERIRNLKILETLNDDDDLDEILNI